MLKQCLKLSGTSEIQPSAQERASQGAIVVKNPPASAEDLRDSCGSLGLEESLEEGMTTQSSILT